MPHKRDVANQSLEGLEGVPKLGEEHDGRRTLWHVPLLCDQERIFIELMTSDRKLKASIEGSK